MGKQIWRRWAAVSVGAAAAALFCVLYVDRPLARLMWQLKPFHYYLARAPVEFPILIVLGGAAVAIALAYRFFGKPFSRALTATTIAGVAVILSVALVEYGLKVIFARTVPWTYLHGGGYGFHWFRAGQKFASFPSAHADQAAAVLSVLWVFYPRWRWVYVVVALVLAFALVAGEWHFLSDVIAGAYVGTVAGAATMSIWDAVSKRRREGSEAEFAEASGQMDLADG